MDKRIPFAEYIQIHRRLRATRPDYYVNNWRLLLPPSIALFTMGFAIQSFFLAGGCDFRIPFHHLHFLRIADADRRAKMPPQAPEDLV